METFIDIARNSILVMIAIGIVAGALLFTANALVSNTVEDQPDDH